MPELLRASAQTWECDAMGHLNVRFYVERAHEALRFLQLESGFEVHSAAAEVVAEHIRFHREVRPGTAYVLRGGWLESAGPEQQETERSAVFEMVHGLEGTLHATFVLSLRHSEGSPADDRGPQLTLPEQAAPRGLHPHPPAIPADVSLARACELGLLPIHRRVLGVADTDPEGWIRPAAFMGCLSDGIPHLVAKLRGQDRGGAHGAKLGGAALEYRFFYRKRARAGDLVEVRSGLRAVGNKTQHFVHWILDPSTGEAWATAEAIAVSFDLEARRAVAFDAETRERLSKQSIPSLRI